MLRRLAVMRSCFSTSLRLGSLTASSTTLWQNFSSLPLPRPFASWLQSSSVRKTWVMQFTTGCESGRARPTQGRPSRL